MPKMAHSMHHFASRTLSILVKIWLWNVCWPEKAKWQKGGRVLVIVCFQDIIGLTIRKKTIAIRQIIFLHLQLLLDLCPSSLWFVFIDFQQNSYVFIFGNLYTLEFLTAHASRIVFVPRSNKFENRTVWNVYIQYNNYQPIFQYFKINWFNPGIHIGI
jgi:hypothetical protein